MDVRESAPQRFGKYELVHEIGKGGMAVVHQARCHGMGGFSRPVVIKRILPELAGEEPFVKMFVEEARLSALLDHPNIVQIHDFGVIDGCYFLAMEYIEGIPLHRCIRYCRRRRPVPPEAAAFIILKVCVALHHAHSLTRDGELLGIVHRDVSPANIMLSVHGGVKLLDFGIAKAVQAIDREETRTGTLKGKWSYMSPEQVVGQQVTPRSDIFSTGIVLWELLTGRRLFKARTDFLTLSNVVQARVTPVTSLRPDLPPELDAICARALARKPKDRYASAEEMADDLEALLLERPYSTTQLAALVKEVLASAEGSGEDESSGRSPVSGSDSASDSAAAAGRETHASAPRILADAPDLLRRNPWILPAAAVAAALSVTGLLLVYLLVPERRYASAGPGSSLSSPPGVQASPLATGGASHVVRGASASGTARPGDIRDAAASSARLEDAAAPARAGKRSDPLAGPGALPRKRKARPARETMSRPRSPAPAASLRPAPLSSPKAKARPVAKKKEGGELPNLKSGDLADPYR